MGKGDKKSRRGKIVIGSSGVRRPSKIRKATLVTEIAPKVNKVIRSAKAEPVTKVKAADPVAAIEAETTATPVKSVKKAVVKPKSDTASE
jgi:ribosomal small subunit protein bTHX